MSLKRWSIAQADKQAARELVEECREYYGEDQNIIDPFCALLLTIRGICDPMEAEEFLSDECVLQNPMSFVDMDKAVERIHKAIEQGEKIAIFGDYDCDGVTSTAVLYTYLISVGADVCYRLPTRDEGYGISKSAVDELHEKKINLIITVDNGISAYDEVEYANSLGIDTVVTDHHLPPEKLPNAVAVVDPKRNDDFCEFSGYAGVGVAFMLICALEGCECEELLPEYGDLVTIGTIADVMPVKSDNRAIIKYGLKLIARHSRASVDALLEAAALKEKEISATSISFGLAPRINAAGRMLEPTRALDLLLCDDKAKAAPLARELCDLNNQRKKLESDLIAEAEETLFANEELLNAPVLIVSGKNWHHGVLGLISAKMSRKFSRPCIAFSIDGDEVTGSARSYEGISIYSLISRCGDLLLGFGGHESAAGLSLKLENLDEFKKRINLEAHTLYHTLPFEPLKLCCKLNPSTLSVAHAYSIKKLEPFGRDNEAPIFGLYNLRIISIAAVGKGNHLKITVGRERKQFQVMKFFTRIDEFAYKTGDIVDMAVTLEINRFADEENLSVVLCDIKPSDIDNEFLVKRIRSFENFRIFGEVDDINPPTREEIGAIYKKIYALGHIFAKEDLLLHILGSNDYFKTRVILDILKEGGLIEMTARDNIEITLRPATQKVDLTKTPTYNKISRG